MKFLLLFIYTTIVIIVGYVVGLLQGYKHGHQKGHHKGYMTAERLREWGKRQVDPAVRDLKGVDYITYDSRTGEEVTKEKP